MTATVFLRRFLLVLLVGAGPAGASPVERDAVLSWQPDFRGHAWVESDGLALRHSFALGEAPVLWMEAEDASAVAYRPAGGARDDSAAGAGRCAHSPERLEFFLDVKQPGKYWSWVRLRLPAGAAGVRHLEGLNAVCGAPVGWVSSAGPAGKWIWVRREAPWEFPAGAHELQMDQWTPGVAVDRVALTRDEKWSPPEDAPGDTAAPALPWDYGTASTPDALFATVLQWKRVELLPPGDQPDRTDRTDRTDRSDQSEPADRKSKIENRKSRGFFFSTDSGRHWQRLPDGGDLSGIPVRGDGTDRIRFRVDLHRVAGEAPPAVGRVRMVYAGERDDLFTIEDAVARYSFARRTGALCGVQNKVTGTHLTPLRRPQPLFSVRLKPLAPTPEKEWELVTSLDAQCLAPGVPEKGAPKTWRFVYRIARADGAATVTLRCAQTAPGELTWTAAVENRLAQHEVVDLTYPIVDGLRAAENPADDTLLINGNYLVRNPSGFGHFLYYWPTNTAPLMDLFSAKEGVAVVAHDRSMRSTGISSRGRERRSVELSLVKVVRVKPGATFTGAPHLVRVHQGDWHATGLIERKWLAQAWPTVQSPLWLQECDGWVPGGWPAGWWSDLGEYAKKVQAQTGFGYAQFWNFQVPGTSWTIAHPNPVNGSAEELRWGIEQMHRAGMRVTFYIQGLLWDPHGDGAGAEDTVGHLHGRDLWPGYDMPAKGFSERWCARDADGNPHAWSAVEQEMCYASPGFQEYKRHWAVDQMMGRLGADGIYWDSLSIGRTCWATDHGHGDDPGRWGIGAQENHRLIRQQARKINPDAVFATEGSPVDTLGQVIDIHLDNAPSLDVVRFLFPKMLIYLGAADGADVKRRKAFLYGCRFDGITQDADQQALLRIRRATKQYLYPATPMDTLGLKIEGPASVQARLFLCDPARTRGAVVTILNEEKAAGAFVTVDTTGFGPVKRAWVVDSAGRDGVLSEGAPLAGGKAFRFPVPPAFASTVLLLNTAEPRVTVEPVQPLARGGTTRVTLRLESLMGTRVRGTVRLLAPQGQAGPTGAAALAGTARRSSQTSPTSQRGHRPRANTPQTGGAAAPFDVAGTAGGTVRLALRAPENARLGLVDFPVEVSVAGGPRFRKVATVYVEPPVRVTPEWVGPERLRVTVENRSGQMRAGTVSLGIAAGEVRLAGGPLRRTYRLKPGEKTTLDAGLEGAYACRVPWAVRGTVTCGRETFPLYTPFRPPILNGSLENYRFRADIPDYWWGTHVDRSPKLWGTGEIGIDDQVAADGRRSYRLVGQAKEWRAGNLDIALKPGTRYRFHIRIRRTANSPNIYASIWEGRRLPDGKQDAVSHIVGQQKEGPLDEWQTFETTFTSLPAAEQIGCRLYLYNMNTPATAWFDDIRLVPEIAP